MNRIVTRKLLLGLTLVAALVVLALAASPGVSAKGEGKVHPAVGVYEQQHPGQKVPVIVRVKKGAHQAASQLSASVGASEDLSLIDAFAAAVSPADVERLASDPDVRMVSLDAVMTASGGKSDSVDHSALATAYPFAAAAVSAWDAGVTGEGVTVAVIDSGISGADDFQGRLAAKFDFSSLDKGPADRNGHGTYVAGIIAGRTGGYVGIAPEASLLSLKVTDRQGAALASDVIQALQWAVDHKDEYGIRVVNISLTSSIADSYRQDPLDAAVEQAWFHGIAVVVAAGNYGGQDFAVDHAPANDPYVISVGAFADQGTADTADDRPADWSGRGLTVDGYAKPEVLAPGQDIVATLSSQGSFLAKALPQAVVDGRYLRLSGTSSSAAVVSGVMALMFQQDPGLTPDQAKFRLVRSAPPMDGWQAPRVDAYAAVFSTAAGQANQDAGPSDLIDPATGQIIYDSVLWQSVLWRSVLWRSVLWSSVLWAK